VDRLKKELDWANKELAPRRKLNGDERDADTTSETKIVEIVSGETVTPVPISWLWHGWLAAGKLHALAGAKGTLKTTIALDLAARITAGAKWPDETQAPCGEVLIWSGEDDFDDTLLPRLLAAGGNASRFKHVKDTIMNGKRRPFDPAHDVPQLLRVAEKISSLKMVIVDPFVSAVAGDSHKNAETRRGLQPFVAFASERKCSVLGLTHFTKGTTGRDPIERVNGSLAFGAVPRLVLVTAKPIDTDRKRRLVRAASNIGSDGGGFEYSAFQEPLAGYDFAAQRVVWGDQLDGTARDLLNDVEMPESGETPAPQRSAAARFLLTLLANGPVPVAKVREEADAAGHSWSTMRRAQDELGIISVKDGFSVGWSWRMPNDVPPGGETDI
jgi:putative DNA primase/helicase